MEYIILFVCEILAARLIDTLYKKFKKLSIFIAILSILAFSIFAGIRSYNVGTDIEVYGLKRFNREIGKSNFISSLNQYNDIEYGYSFINYLVAKFTVDFHWFLFTHQVILSTIVYIIAFREKKQHNTRVALTIASYSFLWFNTSLNILRQSVAILIMLFAYKYLENKEYKKYVTLTLLSTLIHTSSIFCLIAPIMNELYSKKNTSTKLFISIFATLSCFIAIRYILNELILLFPILSKYELYIDNDATAISLRYLAFKVLFLLIILLFANIKKNQNSTSLKTLSAFAIMDVLMFSLSGFIAYGYRMSYFFLIHYIYFIPRIESKIASKKEKQLYVIIVIILLVSYWCNRFILSNFDGTLPYKVGV